MARNSRFSSTSSSGRDKKRPGKDNRRSRDGRPGDDKEKKSFKPHSDRRSSSPKKDFKKKDDSRSSGSAPESRNQRPKASPFYKDRGYGSPDRREPKRDDEQKSRFSKPRSGVKPRRENSPGKPKERKSFIESRLDKQRKTQNVTTEAGPKDDLIRLNKFISNSGVCSRREADELIANGLITVNGKTITELGHKVKPTDDVRHDGKN